MPISKMRNNTFKGRFINTGMHQRPRLLDRPLQAARRLLLKQTSQPGRDSHSSIKTRHEAGLYETLTPPVEPTPHSPGLRSPAARKGQGVFIIVFAKQTLPYLKSKG